MRALLTSCFLVVLVSHSAIASTAIDRVLDHPALAKSFDYCHWRFEDGGTAESLPDFESLLDEETGASGASARPDTEIRAVTIAFAGTEVALDATSLKACQRAFQQGTAADEKAFARARKRFGSRNRPDPSKEPEIARIQSRIRELWAHDQAARMVYIGTQAEDAKGPDRWARGLAVERAVGADAASYVTMRELLETYDWIDIHRFGGAISSHAWILVQHADDHPDFQALALARMEPYLENNGVKKDDYAYLFDRVAVNHGRKQRYGTQPDWKCKNGKMQLKPLEDPENVDQRRAEMGLGTAAEGLAQMNRSVCQ